MSKRRALAIARLTAPLPPLEETIKKLENLAFKTYETKAQTKNAIKNAHRALIHTLQIMESYSRYAALVSKGVLESIHRDILRDLKLEESP